MERYEIEIETNIDWPMAFEHMKNGGIVSYKPHEKFNDSIIKFNDEFKIFMHDGSKFRESRYELNYLCQFKFKRVNENKPSKRFYVIKVEHKGVFNSLFDGNYYSIIDEKEFSYYEDLKIKIKIESEDMAIFVCRIMNEASDRGEI